MQRISGNELPAMSGRIHRSNQKIPHSVIFNCHALHEISTDEWSCLENESLPLAGGADMFPLNVGFCFRNRGASESPFSHRYPVLGPRSMTSHLAETRSSQQMVILAKMLRQADATSSLRVTSGKGTEFGTVSATSKSQYHPSILG